MKEVSQVITFIKINLKRTEKKLELKTGYETFLRILITGQKIMNVVWL